jgi:hypothetical protein
MRLVMDVILCAIAAIALNVSQATLCMFGWPFLISRVGASVLISSDDEDLNFLAIWFLLRY